jgi:hypothetical protein
VLHAVAQRCQVHPSPAATMTGTYCSARINIKLLPIYHGAHDVCEVIVLHGTGRTPMSCLLPCQAAFFYALSVCQYYHV